MFLAGFAVPRSTRQGSFDNETGRDRSRPVRRSAELRLGDTRGTHGHHIGAVVKAGGDRVEEDQVIAGSGHALVSPRNQPRAFGAFSMSKPPWTCCSVHVAPPSWEWARKMSVGRPRCGVAPEVVIHHRDCSIRGERTKLRCKADSGWWERGGCYAPLGDMRWRQRAGSVRRCALRGRKDCP